MKILITSDNHLGYKEGDHIRKDDSFKTFEEVLRLSDLNKVDMILQVGDLFHDNKPSRYCLNRTINILRKYLVSVNNKNDCDTSVYDNINDNNYLNSQCNLNNKYKIRVPFISIHGNHDDPSGINNISALDILNSAGLINYIGKITQTDDTNIFINPIEIGNINIYGIGYMKDKKLTELINTRKIQFTKLSKNNFNILLLHQNRISRNKEFVSSNIFPSEFNLVVYGHEHEPVIVRDKFTILQSGSTIRTSLCEGEHNNKYTYILEDKILYKIQLNSVRRFEFETVITDDENILINKLNCMTNNSVEIKNSINKRIKQECLSDGRNNKYIPVREIENTLIYSDMIPLIRLRVETTNITNFSKNKIAHLFKNKVANPSDLLKFVTCKNIKETSKTTYISIDIMDIIRRHLIQLPLECIPEQKFIDWVDNKSSFVDVVQENLSEILKHIQYDDCLVDDVNSEIFRIKKMIMEDYNKKVPEAYNFGLMDEYEDFKQAHLFKDIQDVASVEFKNKEMSEGLAKTNEVDEQNTGKVDEDISNTGYSNSNILTDEDSLLNILNQNGPNIEISDNKVNKTDILPYIIPKISHASKEASKIPINKILNYADENKNIDDDLISDFSKISSNFFMSDTHIVNTFNTTIGLSKGDNTSSSITPNKKRILFDEHVDDVSSDDLVIDF